MIYPYFIRFSIRIFKNTFKSFNNILFFKGTTHEYLLNKSITHNKYLISLLMFGNLFNLLFPLILLQFLIILSAISCLQYLDFLSFKFLFISFFDFTYCFFFFFVL